MLNCKYKININNCLIQYNSHEQYCNYLLDLFMCNLKIILVLIFIIFTKFIIMNLIKFIIKFEYIYLSSYKQRI